MKKALDVDVLIFGGGVAGLWLLDELRRGRYSSLLVEKFALGSGQTVASQGIIHGGLKYMFDGNINPSARAISEMPVVWRECLEGKREPDLRGTRIRSEGCYIWGTGSIKSRIFMMGSSVALRAAPVAVEREDRPRALAEVPGKVMKVGEPVIDVASMMRVLGERNRGSIIKGSEVRFEREGERIVAAEVDGRRISARDVALTAGEGNGELRRLAGLGEEAMQRRPLHMVMVRGEGLPELFGHCVGGPRPRVTVTTVVDSQGRNVWQVGGQIAEDGVKMEAEELVKHAQRELEACVAGVDLSGAEFATYRVNRAEAATTSGHKPDDAHVMKEGNVVTAWPTKLALAPRVAERVMGMIGARRAESTGEEEALTPALSRSTGRGGSAVESVGVIDEVEIGEEQVEVALPPWEKEARWFSGR